METRATKALAEDIENAIAELESIFSSDRLMDRLKEVLGKLSSEAFFGALSDSFVLYNAFEGNRITLEIIQYINKIFPGAASIGVNAIDYYWDGPTKYLAYPIHFACKNNNCPDEVVVELINQSPFALRQFATIDSGLLNLGDNYEDKFASSGEDGSNVAGLPLHYYLQRESNITLEVLEKLISAYPEGMTARQSANAADFIGEGVSPIYVALANPKISRMTDVLQHLVETYPSHFRETCGRCNSAPIHVAIRNTSSVNIRIARLLVNAWPESLQTRCYTSLGGSILPIHILCSSRTEDLDDTTAMKILAFLIRRYPGSVQVQDETGYLPIHFAVERRSTEFCKVLVDINPESVRVTTTTTTYSYAGSLPIHLAVQGGIECVETVQLLIDRDPESLRIHDNNGNTPLHMAVRSCYHDNIETVKLLLAYDPTLALIKSTGELLFGYPLLHLPLHEACQQGMYTDDNSLAKVQLLFDAYPGAIFEKTNHTFTFDGQQVLGKTPLDYANRNNAPLGIDIVSFLEDQLDYAKMTEDQEEMTTPDKKGRLALHLALLEGAPHGSIKLLLKGNPAALQVADNSGKLPLHLACEYGSVDTVKLFIESSNDEALNIQDGNKNYPLHLACLGKDYKVVQYLLLKGTSVVSKLNGEGKLPLHLLCEEVDNDYETDDEESDSGEEESEGEDEINNNSDRESNKEDNTDNSFSDNNEEECGSDATTTDNSNSDNEEGESGSDNEYMTDNSDSDNEEEESGSDKTYKSDNSDRDNEEEEIESDSKSEYSYSDDIEYVETMMMMLQAHPEIISSFTSQLQKRGWKRARKSREF